MNSSNDHLDPTLFPCLSRLRLSAEELAAIGEQGTVRSERRGTTTIFRLRFRLKGRQRVRYVSPVTAADLAAELRVLQKTTLARRRLRRVTRLAREMLAQRKRLLAPLLDAHGFHLHGHQVRQYRNRVQH